MGRSAGAIQNSRDGNFVTSNKEGACDAFKAGQNHSKLQKEAQIDNIAKYLVTTFGQAVLKYAAEMTQDGANVDAEWTEGYTYFRCAAGLFDPEFATFLETEYSPLTNSYPEGKELYCKIVTKMYETA